MSDRLNYYYLLVYCSLFTTCYWVGNVGAQYDSEDGYCAPYNGKVCKMNVVSNQVWYSHDDETGGWENEKITTDIYHELVSGLIGLCRDPAEKLLCAFAFPQCIIKQDGTPTKLPLCYEDCVATRQQFCYNDWILIEERKKKGLFLKSRGKFRLPTCDGLPRYNRTARPPNCSYLGLAEMKEDQVTCKINILLYLFTGNNLF